MKLISIVIPTKNSAKTLEQCLESIKKQSYQNYELIIVDGSSSDKTGEKARQFTNKFFVSAHERSEARNFGFSKAEGDIFLSIDSDMVLEKNVLRDIAKGVKEHDALIIPEVSYGNDFISRCKDLEKRCYMEDDIVEASRVFPRNVFEDVKGYDANLVFGEDWDIHSRIKQKYRIGRIKSKIFHSTQSMSLISDLKKSYKYGKTLQRYLAKGHPQAKKWLDLRKIFFIRHFSTLKREPVCAAGLTVLKGMEYAAGFIGFLAVKLGADDGSSV